MPYVYKYIDKVDGIVKYVGIVCRQGNNALYKRIREHFNEDEWARSHNWKVEYLEVKTKGDAHALEGHFITFYKSYDWFNKAKADFGLLSFVDGNAFEWKEFNQDLKILNQYYEDFDEVKGWKAQEEIRSRFLSEKPRSVDQMICQTLEVFVSAEEYLEELYKTKARILLMKRNGKSIQGRNIDLDLKQIIEQISRMEILLHKKIIIESEEILC